MSPPARQYQSFPDAPGDSQSLAKLKALRLPLLVGQRFLDIGCNEGFFCGYAQFAGATRVVGLDQSETFITRARQRFAGVEFLHQSWDTLPPGPFDVVLLASSLHYAQDQADLIHRAVQLLSPTGTLVLELGVAEGEPSAWVPVDRGADRRLFPTWAKLNEVLAPHAWKLIAKSVPQKGDPVPRYVLHINARKPVAYLLMQPPGYGKSTIGRELFRPAGVPVVAGDQVLMKIAEGKLPADEALRAVVAAKCSPDALDKTLLALLKAGLLPQLVQVWLAQAGGRTFALDAFVPDAYQELVEQAVRAAGYLVVRMVWDRPGAELRASGKVDDMADAWVAELAIPPGMPAQAMPFKGTLGAVVQLGVNQLVLDVTGWAVHQNGFMPKYIGIKVGEHMTVYSTFDRVARPAVKERLGLPHVMYGFKIRQAIPPGVNPQDVPYQLQVFGGNDPDHLSGPFSVEAIMPRAAAAKG